MTQTADHVTAADTDFEIVGTGQNVYESPDIVEGVAKWLETPQDVMEFVAGGDVSDVIVVSRGGTTTFLSMALNAGIKGVVTLQGAPESHLGILCREYGIPAIMSVAIDKGVRTSRGETIPADGVRLRLDVSSRPAGTVSVEVGAPVDDTPRKESGPAGPSPEELAQIMLLLEKFGGVVPHGSEGDRIMQAEMTTKVLSVDDDESLRRPLTREEVNEAIRYLTWNEWDALAARATEGESGLIPRQEYEAVGIANCWFKHPVWLRAIEDRVGIDGIIEIGAIGRREIGSKINMLNIWAMATAPSFGRGISLELGLHDADFRADRITDAFGVVRRLYRGLWESGPILTSMKNYRAEVLDRSWVDRFVADRIDLADPEDHQAFVRFNGAAELMGFLLHFDNRTGVSDHGPYPLADGGFILARDVFLNEPAWPWNDPESPLPWSVTIAMHFEPETPLDVQVVDISTVFTKPANYLPHVTGVSVYERTAWDAPVETVRALSLDDLVRLRAELEDQSAALYGRIAAMSEREKIESGALTYSAGFALPFARAAGMYDELVADYDFRGIDPAVAACYDAITSGVATEMIPRLFLTGSWGNPVPETATESLSDEDRLRFQVLHALVVRGFATPAQLVLSSGLSTGQVERILGAAVENGHVVVGNAKTGLHTLTATGKGAYLVMRESAIEPAVQQAVQEHYARFLEPNRMFKQLATDWQLGSVSDPQERLDAVHADVVSILDGLSAIDARFGVYRTRLTAAADAFRGGDADAFAKPLSDSYHDVWMELHEDLLAMAGRERSDADG
ncbi:PEP-utilizing enzyme [Microbacterium aurum]